MFTTNPNDGSLLMVETYALTDAEPDLAVVRMHGPDEDLWWIEVRDDVLFREYEYGLEQDAEWNGADVLKDDRRTYDPIKVMTWCKKKIHRPIWKWFVWTEVAEGDERWDDGVNYSLTASLIPRQGWWLGALVTMKDKLWV